MKQNNFDESTVLSIRNAIIDRACRDYMKIKMKQQKHPHRPLTTKEQETLASIRKWFNSEDFLRMHLSLSGQWFIDKMDNMSYEDLHDNLTKKGNPE